MIAHGRVQNGVVVLEKDSCFLEGQEVTVLGSAIPHAALPQQDSVRHSVLEIPVVSLGQVLCPQDPGDDLLGEMLEGRP